MVDNRRYKYAGFFVAAVIAVAVIILLRVKDSPVVPSQPQRAVLGRSAPDITFFDLAGNAVDLKSYRGKVIFLNIWATWCPSCREEMPSMERLYQELKGNDFEILAVSIDSSGATAVAPFMKRHNLSFPALLDPQVKVRNLFGVTGVPESFIIDKEGIVKKVVVGPIDWVSPEMVSFFRSLMQKP